MASTSASEVIINDVTEDTDIWSVGKCVSCNMQLTGEPKILSCLHFVCKDCIGKENSVSGTFSILHYLLSLYKKLWPIQYHNIY